MNDSTNNGHQRIDELLSELRTAGQRPGSELLGAIRALGQAAAPALIALIIDPAEYVPEEGDEENRTGWAPYSAVEILGEMHPDEAMEPLLELLTWDDYDYLAGVVPEALAQFGSMALEPLTAILTNQHHTVWTRWRAVSAMGKMAGLSPELRADIVARLTAQLDTDEPDNVDLDTIRGALVSELVELQATESIPSIIRTFEETSIDPYLISWSDVRDKLDVPSEIAPHLDQTAPRRGALFGPLTGLRAPEPAGARTATALPTSRRAQSKSYRRETPKVGRNDPCPCGSGKKYKKCHGK